MTGGSRGIGEMIAAGFLANGAKVYISSRKADVCDATAARLAEEYGGECISLPADLSELDGIDALAAARRRARVAPRRPREQRRRASWGAPIDEFPENGWDKVMDTNVKGVFFLTQQLLPLLEAARHRRGPGPGDQHRLGRRHPDAVVRHGVLRAVEGRGAHAHQPAGRPSSCSATSSSTPSPPARSRRGCSAPASAPAATSRAPTGTPSAGRCPAGRMGTPEDIAGLAIFLASRAGAFTVGAVITCDGGIVVS